MYEAIYNLLLLTDVVIIMQVGGKFMLDQLWETFGRMFLILNAYAVEWAEILEEDN